MALQQPPEWHVLSNMIDVANPTSISWWPQTTGWKILGLLLLILVTLWLYHRVKIYRFNRYRREALYALKQLQRNASCTPDSLFHILKVTAAYVEPAVAARLDMSFFSYLDSSAKLRHKFDSELGQRWIESLLNPSLTLSEPDEHMLYALTYAWIISHRNPDQPNGLNWWPS
ncbi:MAG: DUF4381 domain-containing protein [Oceanospirillales bacterium]|nr:DUF4381 domain-containing protein [Oceanospirillales bacterium]MBR9886099.1 DUF4381 domain-containing protein [Oceanospirillales bacterium]